MLWWGVLFSNGSPISFLTNHIQSSKIQQLVLALALKIKYPQTVPLRGAIDQENTNFGSKHSKPDFYTIWEKRSWNIGKSWKKLKKVEKWPKNHYLATLGIYLQFHDFQSFSKKITEKILTAWCYNWWSQYVRKFNYFPNNIPKIILGGVKQ